MELGSLFTRVESIEPAQARAQLEKDTRCLLLDVRQRDEYRAGHIPGARLLPLPELKTRYQELPRDKKIIIY